MTSSKESAQFWVALLSVFSVALVTGGSLAFDQYHGKVSDVSMLLCGALISLCSASASWLFRTNGTYNTTTSGSYNGSEGKP